MVFAVIDCPDLSKVVGLSSRKGPSVGAGSDKDTEVKGEGDKEEKKETKTSKKDDWKGNFLFGIALLLLVSVVLGLIYLTSLG